MAKINREFMAVCAGDDGYEPVRRRCGRCGTPVGGELFCCEDVWVCGECFRDLLEELPLCDLADMLDVPRTEI